MARSWRLAFRLAVRILAAPAAARCPPEEKAMNPDSMHIVHVHVRVKPEHIEAFKTASAANARNSIEEPGVARFDVLQNCDDASRFILVEVYRTPEAAAAHKETAHYRTWRDTVAEMMAEPRAGIRYLNIFPDAAGWG